MQRVIRDYVETAEFSSNPGQLHNAVAYIIHLFDFNAFAFLAMPSNEPPVLISNYNDKWQTHYISRCYQSCDPVILNSRCLVNLFT